MRRPCIPPFGSACDIRRVHHLRSAIYDIHDPRSGLSTHSTILDPESVGIEKFRKFDPIQKYMLFILKTAVFEKPS
jgi:hypothetical protein